MMRQALMSTRNSSDRQSVGRRKHKRPKYNARCMPVLRKCLIELVREDELEGHTQANLAERAKVAASVISEQTGGTRDVTWEVLEGVAFARHRSVSQVLIRLRDIAQEMPEMTKIPAAPGHYNVPTPEKSPAELLIEGLPSVQTSTSEAGPPVEGSQAVPRRRGRPRRKASEEKKAR